MTTLVLLVAAWLGYDLLAGPRLVLEVLRSLPSAALAGLAALA